MLKEEESFQNPEEKNDRDRPNFKAVVTKNSKITFFETEFPGVSLAVCMCRPGWPQ